MEAIDIGSRLELLVDDYLIEQFYGDAELQLHEPVPEERVLEMTKPWERGTTHHGYLTVFEDEDRYRMYYAVRTRDIEDGNPVKGTERICYAESEDGIEWNRPSLGKVQYDGSADNNIILTEDTFEPIEVHGFSPFKDANPACDPACRYKGLFRGSDGENLYPLCSQNGLDWEPMTGEPVIPAESVDTQHVVFWDEKRDEYRAYWRERLERPSESVRSRISSKIDQDTHFRSIKTAVSTDFRHWSDPASVCFSDDQVSELYTSQVQPYFRAPHLFVGFPARYVERSFSEAIKALPERERREILLEYGGQERLSTALTDSLFMSSRDGRDFDRWNEAFIRPGLRTKENWFYGDNYINYGIVTTPPEIIGAPEELSFYVSEGSRADRIYNSDGNRVDRSEDIDKAFRRYTLRIDGFVSLNAGARGGGCVTRPITFSGQRLVLNFAASAAGRVRVEVQDKHASPVPGFELENCVDVLGDDLKREVTWPDADISRMSGVPIRLRFDLIDADIYAFQFQ